MEIKIIENECPHCKTPIVHGGIIRYNNFTKDFDDVISQATYCMNCNSYFEVIYVPVKILKSNKKEFDKK